MAATGTREARALDDLYRKHVGEVYRYAYAVLGNHADAEDVTQTAFVNALRALERGEKPRKPGNWLLAIAHNVIRQRWRAEQARPPVTELIDDVAVPERDDDTPVLADVVRALQRIPQGQREALVMRELEGRSYREIAEILGLSASALETLLFRARRSLSEELEHLVTCDRAELAVSKQLDGRLSRKERRRLEAHLHECEACSRFAAGQRRHRKAIRGLAVLPLPLSLAFWKGAPSAAAAASLPSIGLAGGATTAGVAGAGGAAGGVALGGGLVVKAAAVVAALGVTAGVSYEGIDRVTRDPSPPRAPALEQPAKGSAGTPAAKQAQQAAAEKQRGKAEAARERRGNAAQGGSPKRETTPKAAREQAPRGQPETGRSVRAQPGGQREKEKSTGRKSEAPPRAKTPQAGASAVTGKGNAKADDAADDAGTATTEQPATEQPPDGGGTQRGPKPKS